MTTTLSARAMPWMCSALCLALGIAGCGGGDGSGRGSGGGSGTGPPRLITGQFVEQANAACAEDRDRGMNLPYQPTPAARAQQQFPLFDQLITRLSELRPPEKLDAKYQQYLSRLRRGRDLFKEALATPQPYENLSPKVSELVKEDRSFLKPLGLDECLRY